MKILGIILGVMFGIAGVLFYYLNMVPLLGYIIPDECWWVLLLIGFILFMLGLLIP